jgi:hypothetical protein
VAEQRNGRGALYRFFTGGLLAQCLALFELHYVTALCLLFAYPRR